MANREAGPLETIFMLAGGFGGFVVGIEHLTFIQAAVAAAVVAAIGAAIGRFAEAVIVRVAFFVAIGIGLMVNSAIRAFVWQLVTGS